jgi:sec-independent protein translocase protein TatA
MFDIGGPELMLILFIFLLLFGANKMPELAKGLGKSIKEFKKAASGVENELRHAMEEDPPAPPAPKNAVAIEPAAKPENPALPPASAD